MRLFLLTPAPPWARIASLPELIWPGLALLALTQADGILGYPPAWPVAGLALLCAGWRRRRWRRCAAHRAPPAGIELCAGGRLQAASGAVHVGPWGCALASGQRGQPAVLLRTGAVPQRQLRALQRSLRHGRPGRGGVRGSGGFPVSL